MKKRSQIAEKYKWDKSCLCNSEKEFEERLSGFEKYIALFKKFEGK